MAEGALQHGVLIAVERTLDAGTARCCLRVSMGGETVSTSTGMVDLRRGLAALTTRFSFSGTQGRDVTSIIDNAGTVYTFVASDPSASPAPDGSFGLQDRWVAVETEGDGAGLSPGGLLAWLRGVTHAEQGASSGASGFETITLTLDLSLAIERAPESQRRSVRYALENTRMGMTTAVISAAVALDATKRVRTLELTIPPSPSAWLPVAHGDESIMTLELGPFGIDVEIPSPEPDLTLSIPEFMSLFDTSMGADAHDNEEPR